jgi:DNA repair exonuclease SbcCD ATPase subunit
MPDGVLTITRTKLPSRVTVSLPNLTLLEDDAAQYYIHRLIGGEHFELTSYMLQKGTTQFFTLPTADKRKFIESLAKQNNNLEQTKEKVQNRLKDLKSLLISHQTRFDVLQHSSPKKPEYPYDKENLLFHSSKDILDTEGLLSKVKVFYMERHSSVKKLLQHQIDLLSASRNSHSRKTELLSSLSYHESALCSLSAKLESLDYSAIDSIQQKVSSGILAVEYQKKKAELLSAKRNYEELIRQEEISIQTQMKELEDQIQRVSEIDPELYKKAEKDYLSLQRKREISSRLPPETDVEKQSLLVKELKDRVSHAQQRKTVLGCPHCSKGLVIKGSVIDKADAGPLTSEEKQLLSEATQRLPSEEKKLQQLLQRKALREQLLSELEQIKVDEKAEEIFLEMKQKVDSVKVILQKNSFIQEQLTKLKTTPAKEKYIHIRKQYEKELEVFKSMQKGEAVENLEELQQRLQELQLNKITADRTSIEIQQTREKLVEVQKELNSIPSVEQVEEGLVEKLQEESTGLENKLSALDQMEKKIADMKEYAKKRSDYKKWEKSITEAKQAIGIVQQEILSLEMFLRKMNEAETLCLEETIRILNNKLRVYLEKFFPEDPITVELVTEKESKKGSVKTELTVRITQKGEECDLSSLSGGEYDRCSLAFLLAVNELCGSFVLILDESIGSLDMTNAENVLEVLKEMMPSEKVVILVQHQATCGSYDHVVKV